MGWCPREGPSQAETQVAQPTPKPNASLGVDSRYHQRETGSWDLRWERW